MAVLPVICRRCGNVFSSGFSFENAKNVTLQGNLSQCPKCGAMGSVPDGQYNFYQDTIEFLGGPEWAATDLRAALRVLEKARDEQTDIAELTKELEREAPALAAITRLLPENKSQAYQLIGLILLALNILLSQCTGVSETVSVAAQELVQYVDESLAGGSDPGPTPPPEWISKGEPFPSVEPSVEALLSGLDSLPPPHLVEGRVFVNSRVILDNIEIQNCKFYRCELTYLGLGPLRFRGNHCESCRWTIGGPALATVEALRAMRLGMDQLGINFTDSVIARIRGELGPNGDET